MTKPHGREKYRARENRSRIRAILREKWDPIGVAGKAPDEYHTYADKAYVMMMYDGASADEVARYLQSVASDYMGLSDWADRYDDCRAIAEKILALKVEFQRPLQ